MKQLNFLSKSSSQSCSHSSVTLAMTVGSPSVHRRCALVLPLLFAFAFMLGVGNAWGADVTTTLAAWSFSSSSYPANATNFNATSGTMATNSTFYLNGSGSTWNTNKGYAFTAVTDITITLKLNQKLTTGAQITLAADVFFNAAKNKPVDSYDITVKVGSASASTSGLGTTNWQLSNSSANKTVTYTTQSTIASGTNIQFIFTQKDKVGAGQAYFNNVTITSTTYTVTYNANNGSGSVPTDNTAYCKNAEVTVKGNTGPVVRSGYTFEGWNTNNSGTGTNYAAGTGTFTITGNTTLYAKWESAGCTSISPTLTYASNTINIGDVTDAPTLNKDGSNGSVTYESGTPAVATVDADGKVTALTAGTTVITAVIAAEGDKCAGTAERTITVLPKVTLNAGTGSFTGDAVLIPSTVGSSVTLPSATPSSGCSSNGWSFAGWCTTSAGSAESNTSSPGILIPAGSYTPSGSANTTLYAVYTKSGGTGTVSQNYTISFKDNDSDSNTDLTTTTFADEVASGASNISSVSSVTKCYAGDDGIKMASGKYNGSFTLTLANSHAITGVTLNTKKKSTTNASYGVTVGSTDFSTSSTISASEFVNVEFTGTKTTSNSLTISSTSSTSEGSSADGRVAWLASITVYEEVTGAITYYMTSLDCCIDLGAITGVVTLSQLASGDDKGKLKATWPSQTATDGWAANGIQINIYEDGNATPVVISSALANSATSFTASDFTPKKCTDYYATLTAIHGGSSTYCAGNLVSDPSEKVTTAGYTYTVTLTGDHVEKTSGTVPATTCDGSVEATYQAVSGWVLPTSITVTNAGDENDGWLWEVSEGVGTLTIIDSEVTGNVVATITATAAPCDPMSAPSVTVTPTYNGASLSWGAVTHASKYKVYIYNNDDSSVESNENVTGTSYTVSATLANLTTYKYRVDAVSEDETLYCSSFANSTFTTLDYPTVKLFYSENGVLSEGVDKKILTDIILPSTAAECDKQLVGWTTAANASYSHASAAPDPLYAPGKTDFQIPTNANCTLYAVYANVVEASTSWTRVTAVKTLTDGGTFIMGYEADPTNAKGTIVPMRNTGSATTSAAGYMYSGTGSGTTSDATTLTMSSVTETAAYEISVVASTEVDDAICIKIGDNFLGNENAKNSCKLYAEEATTTAFTPAIGDDDAFTLDIAANTSGSAYRYMKYNTGAPRFAVYSTEPAGIVFYKKSVTEASTTNYSTTCQGKVAKPVITGVTGGTTYESAQTITITSETTGATIHYTTDGTEPTTSSATYSAPFTLSTNGDYTIRAIAVKTDMTNSDEATSVSFTLDLPFTTIAELIGANLTAGTTGKKLAFTAESNAIITAVNSSNRYVQDASGKGIVIRSSSWDEAAVAGKKIVGTITGTWDVYEGQMQLKDATFSDGMTFTATELPDAVTVSGDAATAFGARPTVIVKLEDMYFQAEALNNNYSVVIEDASENAYTIYDRFNVLQNKDLPLITTACDVTGILTRYIKNNSTTYQIVPLATTAISTKGADAVLPTISDAGGVDAEHAVSVATGKVISITEDTNFDAVYKVNDGEETEISSLANITISDTENATKLYVKASRDFYDDSEVTYYSSADNNLVENTITCATGLVGGTVSADKNSATSGTTVTITASPKFDEEGHYQFGSWDVYKTGESATKVSVTNDNGVYTFQMPAYAVTVSATFAEDPYATVSFVGGTGATGSAPASQKVYVGYNATMPACTFKKDGCSFLAWELNSNTYEVGDTYEVTSTDDVEFTATWQEKIISKDGQWELVTDENELSVGDFIVIAQNAQGKTESADIGGQSNKYLTGVATTFSGDNNEYITKANLNATSAIKYVLGGTSGAWILTDDATGKELQQTGNPSWVTEGNGNVWNITIANGNAYLYPGTNNTTSRILYNTSGGFRAYTSGTTTSMLLPQIYKFYRTAYKVTYDANGGEGAPKLQRANPETNQVTISATEPTRENYTFTGWKDSENNSYSGTVTLTGDVTLYAQWTADPFNMAVASVDNVTISATPAGASAVAEGENADVAHGTEVTLAYSDVDNAYMFKSWSVTKADDAETVVTVTNNKFDMPTYAVNVSAVIEAKASVNLTLTYDANGGEGTLEGNPFGYHYDDQVTVVDNPFTKSNHFFIGWKDQDDNTYKAGDEFAIQKDMTLTAQWRANGATYTIASTSSVNASADVPSGSSAVYSQTYTNTKGQMTANNSTTLTLKGYDGKIIKGLTLNLRSNTGSGSGSFLMTVGTENGTKRTIASLEARAFNDHWFDNNSYSSSTSDYRDVHVTMQPTLIGEAEEIIITIAATVNSLYLTSYTIDYDNTTIVSGTTDASSVNPEPGDVVVVPNGATLNMNTNKTYDNLTVEAGGTISGSANLTVNDLTIKTSLGTISGDNNTGGKSGQITNSNITASGDVFIEIELTQESQASYGWYAFSVPFEVDALNGVYYQSTKLTNEVGYAIMKYHEDIRSTGEYAWKKYRGIMQPGELYIITVADTDYKTLRFKKHGNTAFTTSTSVAVSKTGDDLNSGWNGLGNPNLQVSYTTAETYMHFLDHEANAFKTREASKVNLAVGSAFFIQYSGDGNSIAMNLGSQSGEGTMLLAPARTPKAVENIIHEVKLINAATDKEEDNVFFTAREEATNSYEIGRDVAKMSMGTAKCAQMMIPAYGTNLCAADFPLVNDQVEYPLTITTPAAGEYRIEAAEDYADAAIYLTKDGIIIWNLSMAPYEVELQKGTTNEYGLKIVATQNAATGVEQSVVSDQSSVQKVIIDEHVFILRGEQMYDVTGKAVK